MVARKLPGSMPISALKALIASRFGLGDGRTATFLITSVVDEPADRLATDAAVTTWLDSAMAVYSAYAGISVQAGAAAAAAPGAMAATYSAGPAAIPDKKVSAITTLQTLLALKLKRSIQNVPADATVKELVSGKSALQNELIGDIAKEFGRDPQNGSEAKLSELAAQFDDGYRQLGPVTTALVNKLFSMKMAAGFSVSTAKAYLAEKFGFPAGHAESIFVSALLSEPAVRHGAPAESQAFFDQIATAYASANGISLGGGGGSGGGMVAGPSADPAALKDYKAKHEALMRRQLGCYHEFLDMDVLEAETKLRAKNAAMWELEKTLDAWLLEHGDVYSDGIKQSFDPRKTRKYDSAWAWANQDCMALINDLSKRTKEPLPNLHERMYLIENRATKQTMAILEYHSKQAELEGRTATSKLLVELKLRVGKALAQEPVYRDFCVPTKPQVTFSDDGGIKYSEVRRSADMAAYAQSLRSTTSDGHIDPAKEELLRVLAERKVGAEIIEQVRSQLFPAASPSYPCCIRKQSAEGELAKEATMMYGRLAHLPAIRTLAGWLDLFQHG